MGTAGWQPAPDWKSGSREDYLRHDEADFQSAAGFQPAVQRRTAMAELNLDIVCVGFGPATGGFLTTLSPALSEFAITPQVICYERADGLGYGVSGAVTKARGIRHSFPQLDASLIPMAASVADEKVVYLFDPIGASRRSRPVRLADKLA